MYQLSNGTWRSDFRISGKRHQPVWETTSKHEALKLEKELKAEIRANLSKTKPKPSPQLDWLIPTTVEPTMTLSNARDWMYERKWKHMKDSKNPVNRFNRIIEHFGDIDILELNTQKIVDFRTHLLEVENKANKTVNNYLSVLKSTIELLHVTGKVTFNKLPSFIGLRLNNVGERTICFTNLEEHNMFDTLKKQYQKSKSNADWEMLHYFIINANLGLRPAEFLFMPCSSVDLQNKKVSIRFAEHGDTKNGVVRTLPIDGNCYDSFLLLLSRTLELLTRGTFIEELGEEMRVGLLTENDLDSRGTLRGTLRGILEKYGTPLTRQSPITRLSKKMVETRWKNMRKSLGWTDEEVYKDYVPYGLRHTVASRLAGDRNFNGHQVMSFMGHKDLATSMKYVHLNVSHIETGINLGGSSLKV